MEKLSTKYTLMHFLHNDNFAATVGFVLRESKNKINYLFMCKNIPLLSPIFGFDFFIQSAKSRNDNDIAGAPAKYLKQSI